MKKKQSFIVKNEICWHDSDVEMQVKAFIQEIVKSQRDSLFRASPKHKSVLNVNALNGQVDQLLSN